ncbi:MAG TPA: hypothetical protein VKZ95_02440 [Sphingobacteriaceae bacterium]|nr:hypothetical protein [Sphingobacteriaceae bacterium]
MDNSEKKIEKEQAEDEQIRERIAILPHIPNQEMIFPMINVRNYQQFIPLFLYAKYPQTIAQKNKAVKLLLFF